MQKGSSLPSSKNDLAGLCSLRNLGGEVDKSMWI